MSYTNDRDSAKLNQAAAHDTSLYDENVHDNQIVAMYDTDAQARSAKDALVAKGVSAGSIQVVSRGTDTGTLGGVNAEDDNGGVWGALRSLFVPDDDRSAYSHAVGRGHAMLVVTPAAGSDRVALVHALEATGPVDFDAKLEEWRQAGYDHSTPHADYVADMPPAMDSPVAAMADADPVVSGAVPPPARSAEYPTPPATATRVDEGTQTGGTATPMAGDRGAMRTDTAAQTDEGDTIKLMEERLRVGKREVAAGAVRIRSYIVERPVEEQVTLHNETVQVERHPVDRAASPADLAAFQERSIEARATSEEAVVSKDARVVEEIGLKKTATDRVETVRDTVRKTEVEIEDGSTRGSTANIDPVTGKPRTTPGA